MDRRQFLISGPLAAAAFTTQAATLKIDSLPPPSPSPAGSKPQRDYWNDLPNRMTAQIAAIRAQRKSQLAKLASQAAAEERSRFLQARAWDCVGGRPEATPLNPMVTGVLEREQYRVEKIVFESQPRFFVTAHLYLPKAQSQRVPGILAPLGHYPEGKAKPMYQTLFQNLARKGYAVMAFDPPGQGERWQYLNAAGNRSLFGPVGEHDRLGWPALLTGSSTTQFEAWDGIRALDYMLTRPEVDGDRIGCCGHSGGGTQTMFLCALEPRIKVAVVVEGHTENVAGADYQAPGAFADAEQNLIGGLALGVDRGDLLAAFAPKPLRICYSPIDNATTYSAHYIAGTHEIFAELQDLYGVYGARDKVTLFASTLPHAYDYLHRGATYEWFNRWLLQGHGDEKEAAFESAPEQALWCTTTGQVLTSVGGRQAFEVNHDRLRAQWAKAKSRAADTVSMQKELREILHLPPPVTAAGAQALSSKDHDGFTIAEVQFESEPGIRVPGWFVKPTTSQAQLPVVLVLSDQGRDSLFEDWARIEQTMQMGVALCSIDLRTCGVTRPRLPSRGPCFYGDAVDMAYVLVNLALGTPILGQQTQDLLSGIGYLLSRSDVDQKRIAVSATGFAGIPATASALLDERICSLFLDRSLSTIESVVGSKEYEYPLSALAFGLARSFDLPDMCASLGPRPVWLVNSTGANGESPLAKRDFGCLCPERQGGTSHTSHRAERGGCKSRMDAESSGRLSFAFRNSRKPAGNAGPSASLGMTILRKPLLTF